jgi:hypothetical protein
MAKRYGVNDIIGLKDTYRGNPSTATGVGQVVFASYSVGGICMGMCVSGSTLTPWAVRPVFCCSQSSGCGSTACVTNGFAIGTGTFVALGGGGVEAGTASLWRRIS